MSGVFRFLTAGESHGEALVAFIDGVPAGLPLAKSHIDEDPVRRQRGGPITLQIANRDWEN